MNSSSSLLGAAAALLLLSLPASASVSANFQPSRTDCVSPCAVYVDATEDRGDSAFPLTSSSVSSHDPVHDLHYQWSFGDSGAGSWGTTGKLKNRAYGPQAAHLYEIPEGGVDQTFTIQLRVTAPDGSTDTVSKSVTVRDPASAYSGKTVCISRNGDASGCPSGGTKLLDQTGTFESIVSNQISSGYRRILFKRGQNWTSKGHLRINTAGPGTLGAFGGNSTPPTIRAQHDGRILLLSGSTIRFEDWRIMDLRFAGSGNDGSGLLAGGNQVKKLTLLRVSAVPGTFHDGISLPQNSVEYHNGPDVHHDIAIVETDLEDFGFGSGGTIGFFAVRRLAFIGNRWMDSTGGEHILRVQYGDSVVVSNNFMRDQDTRKHVVTIRSLDAEAGVAGGEYAQNVVISDNELGGSGDITVAVTQRNKSTWDARGRDMIFERNFCNKSGGDGPQICFSTANTSGVTIRNNLVQLDGWLAYRSIELQNGSTLRAYNNSCYTKDNPSQEVRCVRIRDGAASASDVRNNVLFVPNASNADVVAGSPAAESDNLLVRTSPFVSSAPTQPEDFEPRSGGPIVDAGYPAASNRLDFGLVLRKKIDSEWDVGAFELGGDTSDTTLAAPYLF